MASSFPKLTGNRQHQLAQIVAFINAHDGGDSSLSESFLSFANANPQIAPAQAFVGWLLSDVGHALPTAISGSIVGGAQLVGEGAVGAGEGIGTASKNINNAVPGLTGINAVGDFFHRLSEGSTWARIGEGLLGAILLYVGIKAVTSGTPAAEAAKPVKKAAKGITSVAAPELRLARRAAAQKVAPKTTARITAHRAAVEKFGGRKPYSPPAAKPPHVRVSHVYHHPATKPKAKP